MKKIFSVPALTGALVLAGTVTASANLIDFTDDTTPLILPGEYEVNGVPTNPNQNDNPPFAPIPIAGGSLVGDNDGLGIIDDELSNPGPSDVTQYVTITFNKVRTLTAAYFLDVFIDPLTQGTEEARVNVGSAPDAGTFVGGLATEVANLSNPSNAGLGLVEITGLNLQGTTFTFWVGSDNDSLGFADGSLAAVKLAPIPLPASGVLLLGAVGGLAFARRRAKA